MNSLRWHSIYFCRESLYRQMKGETIEVDLYITQYLPKPVKGESLLAIYRGGELEICLSGWELLLVTMILRLIV